MDNDNAERQAAINAYKTQLDAIDREAGAGRALRGLTLKAAELGGITGDDDDYVQLREYETRAEVLRQALKDYINQGAQVP